MLDHIICQVPHDLTSMVTAWQISQSHLMYWLIGNDLTFQLLCNFGNSETLHLLINVKAMHQICFLPILNFMSLLLWMAALVVVRVLPKSSPLQFLEVWELSHCQCIYMDEVVERNSCTPITYAHFLDEQTLDLHRTDQEALHVSCSFYCAGTFAVISCKIEHITLPETCYT